MDWHDKHALVKRVRVHVMAPSLSSKIKRLVRTTAIVFRLSANHVAPGFLLAVTTSAVVGICGERTSSRPESIVVQLRNGRLLAGEVDARTDESELWLRSSEPSIVLSTAIPWTDLKAVQVQNKTISPGDFRQIVRQLVSPSPAVPLRQPAQLASCSAKRASSPPVRSLEFVASLANSDLDREANGIELRVSPLTATGEAVAVDGMISVQILGRRVVSNDRLESHSGLGFWSGASAVRETRTAIDPHAYLEVGAWNERLRKSDLTAGGYYLLRLPFRNVIPERDLDLTLDAQVDAKLSVQGQDIFYATSPIQLRKFSRLREDLQLNRGVRLFPGEYLTH